MWWLAREGEIDEPLFTETGSGSTSVERQLLTYGGSEAPKFTMIFPQDPYNRAMIHNRQSTYFAVFLFTLACLFLFFRESWISMAHVWWNNETFSHGLLILPISAWLVWRNRQVISNTDLEPSLLGLVGLVIGAFGWLLGSLADVHVVQHLGVVTMLVASIPMVFGIALTKSFAFPVAFLFFMVPAGDFLVPMLMQHTADVTIFALQFSGIPVFRENMHFTLPTGRWSVVEACSGLRYVIAALVLAFMFAYLNYRSWTKKTLFIFLCLVVAIVANWARAYMVVLVGHFSSMKYGTGNDHIYYGWFFFGIVMFVIFWIGMRWRDEDLGFNNVRQHLVVGGISRINDEQQKQKVVSHTFLRFTIILVGIGLLAAFRQAPSFLLDSKPRRDIDLAFKASNGEFKAANQLELTPVFKSPVAKIQGALPDGTEVFIAYYAKQTDDSEMITVNNFFVSSSDPKWTIMASSSHGQGQIAGLSAATELTLKGAGGEARLAWMWYCVGGYCAKEASLAKGLTAFSALRGKGDHSIAVLLSAPIVESNIDRARATLATRKSALDYFAMKFTSLKPIADL